MKMMRMTGKTKFIVGALILAAGIAVAYALFFPICFGDIPSCSTCELVYASPSSTAHGKFTCLDSKYQKANVVTNLNTTEMTPAPVKDVSFSQAVPTSTAPSTAYIQLRYRDSSGFWQDGRKLTLPIH
jgi:hypothetical protein